MMTRDRMITILFDNGLMNCPLLRPSLQRYLVRRRVAPQVCIEWQRPPTPIISLARRFLLARIDRRSALLLDQQRDALGRPPTLFKEKGPSRTQPGRAF